METILEAQLSINIIATVVAFIIYAFLQIATAKSLKSYGKVKRFPDQWWFYIRKFFRVFYVATLLTSLVLIWGIDLQAALVILSSMFAVIGIGLFANWSILSNITASFIIFFSAPYKIGDTVRIVDGENSAEGRIISYPNNLVMQKPVVLVPAE